MKEYRNTLILILIIVVILLLVSGPCRTRGMGLRGVMESGGHGPTWVTVCRDNIFVSNTGSSTLDVFSMDTGDFIRRIAKVTNVGMTIYSRETGMLYAAIGTTGAGALLQINPNEVDRKTNTYRIEQQLNMDVECRAVAITPDGKYIFTAWGGLQEGPGWLTRAKSDNFEALGTFGVTRESPTAILISPDNQKAYVSSHYAQRNLAAWLGEVEGEPEMYSIVEVFDISDEAEIKLIKELQVGLKPQSMAAFGDGRYIIVASAAFENENLGLPGFSIIDTETDEVIKGIETPGVYPFMVTTSDMMGKAFATYLYKVPIAREEDVEEGSPDELEIEDITPEGESVIEVEVIGGDEESEDPENGEVKSLVLTEEEPKYAGMYGRGFLAVDLETYEVHIYEDEHGLPYASLCILDSKRMIAVSPLANRLVILEAEAK